MGYTLVPMVKARIIGAICLQLHWDDLIGLLLTGPILDTYPLGNSCL